MKVFFVFAMLLAWCAIFTFPQTNPGLAVLPFTGGTAEDGEKIAAAFSSQRNIANAFTVIPGNNTLISIFNSQSAGLSGLTDADIIADIGRRLDADYVLSGSIRRLDDIDLVIATIIRVATFEQVAGFYHPYSTLDEVIEFVPSMTAKMISTVFRDTSRLSGLAIMPLDVEGISVYDAETLANVLAIEIHNTGSYAVIPRTAIIAEHLLRNTGDEDGDLSLPVEMVNVQFVLNTEANEVGNSGRISSRILDANNGRLLSADSVNYRTVFEGVDLMGELAILLTTRPGTARDTQIAEHRNDPRRITDRNYETGEREFENGLREKEARRLEREAAAQAKKLRWAPVIANARRNVIDVNFAYYFDGVYEGYNSAYVLGLGVYFSPIPFVSLGLEGRFGWHWINGPVSAEPAVFDMFIASPAVGLVIPLGRSARIFANGMFDMGTFGPWESSMSGWWAPGFDTGIEFTGGGNGTFNLRYRGIWLEGTYTHAAGVGFGFRF